jgi:hypothetical protein
VLTKQQPGAHNSSGEGAGVRERSHNQLNPMTAWTTNQIFAFGAVAVLLLGAANAIAAPAKAAPYNGLMEAQVVDPAARVQAFLR